MRSLIGKIIIASIVLVGGCSDGNRTVYEEKFSLEGIEYVVEVKPPFKSKGNRLWIYEQGVNSVENTTSEFAGISFAIDNDGDNKVDSLKGPLAYYGTEGELIWDELNNVLRNYRGRK